MISTNNDESLDTYCGRLDVVLRVPRRDGVVPALSALEEAASGSYYDLVSVTSAGSEYPLGYLITFALASSSLASVLMSATGATLVSAALQNHDPVYTGTTLTRAAGTLTTTTY